MNNNPTSLSAINLAMKLTWFRLIISPIFAWLFFLESLEARIFTLLIAILVEISDILDGYIARKRNEVTNLGKILDPLADRVTHLTFFLCIAWAHLGGMTGLWMVLIVFYREALIETLRVVCAYQGIVVEARASGKIKTISQAVIVISILFGRILETILPEIDGLNFDFIYLLLLIIVAIITIWSAFDYILGQWSNLSKIMSPEK